MHIVSGKIKIAKINFLRIISFALVILFVLLATFARADEYTSTNFKILEPVMMSGGYASSTNFQLFGVISQMAISTSTATNFGVNSGFLYFPYVSTPAVSATPGDGKVDLSWTPSTGLLGWTVSGYNVGQSTNIGGPYTYSSSLGNVWSSSRSGLTNGTTYYFVVRPEDAFGNSIATSSEVSATPVAAGPFCGDGSCNGSENCSSCSSDCGVCPGGGGGGGGGGVLPSPAAVNFSGRAYPNSSVTLLKDGQLAVTTVAGGDANFMITLSGLSGGNYIFSIYGDDKASRRSNSLNFPISLTAGATTNVTGIFISPTIAVDKEQVKKGDNIAIFGQSAPKAEIVISVASEEEYFSKTPSDKDGIYLYNFDTSILEIGQHITKSKASVSNQVSSFSKAVSFMVGTKNVMAGLPAKCPVKADLNNDCRVNLIDFSIAAYWYKRPLSEAFKQIEKEKLNGDGKVTLVDFSIMAYYWTG